MRDELRRISDFGSGVAELTFNRAERVVKEFMRAADMGEESNSVVKEWIEKGRQGGEELLRALRGEIKSQIESFGLATKKDVERLETRIMDLEGLLARSGVGSGPGAPRTRAASARAAGAPPTGAAAAGAAAATGARARKPATPPGGRDGSTTGSAGRRKPPPKTTPGGPAAAS